MSASHTPSRIRWVLPVFGLTLGLVALCGLIVILNASAAPPAPAANVRPALAPSTLAPAPVSPTAPSYRPPDGRSVAPQSPARAWQGHEWQEDEDLLLIHQRDPLAGRPVALTRASSLAPAIIAAGKVITFGLDGTVRGYTDANSPVRLTLTRGGTPVGEARTRSDGVGYFQAELMYAGRYATALPGDVLQVNATVDAETLVAPNITAVVHPATDTVTGQITGVPRPAQLRVEAWGNVLAVITDGAGNFTANLAPVIDLTWYTGVTVSYQDADGDWLALTAYPQNGMLVAPLYNEVLGYTTPGSDVTVSVNHAGAVATATTRADARTGVWWVIFDAIVPGDIVTAQVGGGTPSVTVPAFTAVTDPVHDRLTGTAPPGAAVTACLFGWDKFTTRTDCRAGTAAGGAYVIPFDAGQMDTASTVEAYLHPTPQADIYQWGQRTFAQVRRAGNSVYGYAAPAAAITAQLTDDASPPAVIETVNTTADARNGYFRALFNTPMADGWHVLVQGGGLAEDIVLDPLTPRFETAADRLAGQAPAFGEVRLYTYWPETSPRYFEVVQAGADGSYQLDLAGTADLRNGLWAFAEHPQDNAEDGKAWLGASCYAPYLEINETHDGVWGAVSRPGVPVTLTLRSGSGTVKADMRLTSSVYCSFGWQQFDDGYGGIIDIAAGDTVTFEEPGWSQTVTAVPFTTAVLPAAERVTGIGPANSWVEVQPRSGRSALRVPTDAAGAFEADFTGLADIRGDDEIEVSAYDHNWNRSYAVARGPYARANLDWDAVDGWFGPGVAVQFTVADGAGNPKGGGSGIARPDGWLDGIWCGCDMQPGDHVFVQADTGFQTELTPIPITGEIDLDADRVSGQMFDADFPGRVGVWLWSPARGEGRWREADVDASGNYVVDFAPDFDIINGDNAEVWYFDANRNQVGIMVYTPYLHVRANRAHDWVQGDATPQTTVFVTVTRGAQIIGTGQSFTGGGTWYHVNPQRPEGGNVDMRTGDIVNVTAGELTASVLLIDMDGAVDAAADVVSGRLAGVPFPASVRIEIWRQNGDSRDLQTDALGNFSIDFGATDIGQGDQVGIWYVRPDGHMAGIVRSDFRFETDLRDDDLWGMATPRSRVDLELRAAGGALKGQATIWTDQEGNYGTTFWDALGQRIDIQAGDIVNGTCGTKHATMTIPTPFSASYDHVADTICGQAPAGTLVRVDLWGTQWVTADNSNNYCATFSGDPGIEADGQAQIELPPGHTVRVRTRTPTPALWLNKWSDGEPPSGGYHRYTLRLGNGWWADMAATGVVLTDTLPAGTAFVSESTGSATVTGNLVVWRLAAFGRGAERDITLTVRVNAAIPPGAELENCAEVAAAGWEQDRGNNTACDRRSVVPNEADLWIGGWVSPGDPAPGGEYIYHLDYGNGRPAGSRDVRIIDTLPAGTTFLSEWHPDGWTVDLSQPGKVIWHADYLPGWQGRYVELHLRVDPGATPGTTQLQNRVEIAGQAPDADTNNNVWEDGRTVQSPYGNVSVGKWYSHGIPVAGYEYTAWVFAWSHGNVPATGVVLTDTLPAGATFVRAVQWQWDAATGDYNTSSPFPPAAQGPGWVRWNLPGITTWREFRMQVTFRIGTGTAAGTELVNQADVALPGDQDPGNNHAEHRFHTQPPGPNLRVSKWYEWGETGAGDTLQYQLLFENNGTEPIYDLVFRDILPDHTTLSGWGWEQPAIDGNTLTWIPNWQQNPGDQLGFWLQVRVDDGTPPGALLTNTAEGSTSTAEVSAADNAAQVSLVSGPDLRVEKELLDEIRPGYRARYRIRIWNEGRAWAPNAVLTDILPPGLAFVGSDWGGEVEGNQVTWQLGGLGRDWYGEFNMEVEAARDLAAGSTVTNRLEITNERGDANPANNSFELPATVGSAYRINVQESHNWVNGEVLPGAHVIVVLRDGGGAEKARLETDADGDGYFWAPLNADIAPGDVVRVDTEGTATIVIPVIRIDGVVNAAADRIAGQVYGVPYPASVVGEIWAENGTQAEGQTDGAGHYDLSFAPFDVRNGHMVALWYVRPDGHRVGIVRSALFVRVYPTDNYVWGSTAPDTAVNITLRDAANNVKGTASATSGPDGDWSTDLFNGGARVEIDDHDRLHVTAGGVVVDLVVPRITVLPDAPHDRLEVYSELPNASFDVRWDSTPGQTNHDLGYGDRVTADSAGHATLDFGPHGGLALNVAGNLYYYDPDGHCIEPWWRAMLDAITPTTMVNTSGQTLTLSGVGFQATPTVYLGQAGVKQVQLTNVTLIGSTGTVLQATVPAGTPAGVYELHVYNPDERIGFLAGALTVSNPAPLVASIAPNMGYFDETISFSITGSNFVAGAEVHFTDGTHLLSPTNVVVVSAGQITGQLDLHGAAPGRYDVVVKNPGPGAPSNTLANGFLVKPRWRIRLPLTWKGRP